MSMKDKEAAEVLRKIRVLTSGGRRNGKSGIALLWSEAISRAISTLGREPRPVIVKGRLFERWYCPACFQSVKKGGRFCRACGQVYRARWLYDGIKPPYIPPPPRQTGTKPPQIVIFDESNKTGGY